MASLPMFPSRPLPLPPGHPSPVTPSYSPTYNPSMAPSCHNRPQTSCGPALPARCPPPSLRNLDSLAPAPPARGPAQVSSGLPGVILQGTWPSGVTFHVFVCCWSASCSKLPAPEATGASQAHTTAVGGTDEQVGDRGSVQGCVRVRERASLTFATAAPGPAPRVMPGSVLM